MKKQFDFFTFAALVILGVIGLPVLILFFFAIMNNNFWNVGQYIPSLSSQELEKFLQTNVLVLPKTMWDFLQLLIVPLLISVMGIFYTQQRTRLDKRIADDQRNEDVMQNFIESIGEMILNSGYDKDKENPIFTKNQITIAEARTLLIMRQLDSKRKSNVVCFLYNSNLIGGILPGMNPFGGKDHTRQRILGLKKVDLSSIDLSHTDLPGIDLSYSILTKANFEKAVLASSNLLDTDHEKMIIKGANFEKAILPHDLKSEIDKKSKK